MNTPNGTMDFEARLRLDQLERDLEKMRNVFQQSLRSTEQESNKVQQSINNLTKSFVAFLSIQQAQQFIANIVRVRSEFQKTELTFETMLKSKEKANALISEMLDLAAKTPFSLQDVNEGAKRLLAFQVPANEVTETLRRMGDVAAGLGVPMGQLIHVYGQVKAQGKLMTNDLYQFMNAGIPIIAELSKVVNKSEQEIKEMVSQGKIGFGEIQQVIKNMTDAGGLFHDMNAKLSKSLDGQISNLKDNFQQMINEIGKSSEGVISSAISGAGYLVENYRAIGKILAVLIATYGSYKTAIMTVSVAQSIASQTAKGWTIAQLAQYRALLLAEKAQKLLNATMLANPYVLVGTAIASLVASYFIFRDSATEAEKAQKRFNEAKKEITETIKKERDELQSLIDIIKDENAIREKRIEAFDVLKSKYPEILQNIKTEQEFVKNLTEYYKKLNNVVDERANQSWEEKLKIAENRVKQVQERYNNLQNTKGRGLIKNIKLNNAKEELAAAKNEVEDIKKHLQYQEILKFEAGFRDLSKEERQRQKEYIIQELNLRKAGKKGFDGYSHFSDGNLGRLHQSLKDLMAKEEKGNIIIDKRLALQKELLEVQNNIKNITALNNKEGSTENRNKQLEELKARKKAIEENLKNNFGIENDSHKKSEKSNFDNQAHLRQTQRLEIDRELAQEKTKIDLLADGYQKERQLIDFHYKEKAEAIRRGAEDMRFALEKERKDSKGQMTQEAFELRWQIIDQTERQSNENNEKIRKQQEEKLLKNLLEKYQSYEEKKTKIAKEFDEEIAELQKKNINGIYDKNISEAKKRKAETLLQLETSSSDANTAISNLFGDMSKKSIADLEALQKAGEEAFEKLKASGTLGVEALKAIEDKLKSNKELIRSLSPLFKQLSADFKTLSNKNVSVEEKNRAFQGISENIHKSTQALTQFGDVLNSLGSNTLSEIANTLSEIAGRATGVASTLKSLGVGGGLSLGIGLGVGVLTSVMTEISNARQRRTEAERQQRELEIEHQKKLADLEHQRILQMKQFKNAFVENKMGAHIEQLNTYNKKVKELADKAKTLQNSNVLVGYEKKSGWFRSLFSIYSTWSEAVYKPFKDSIGKLVDEAGNLNYELIEKLNPNDPRFREHVVSAGFGHIDFAEGNAKFIKEIQDLRKKAQEMKEELSKYVNQTFGELGNNFADNIISSVQKGTNAFDNFGTTVSNVMKNLINQMLVTNKIKKMFDDFNNSIANIYAQNLGVDNAIVFEKIKDKTIEFVNKTLKPEIEKGEALTKNIFDELEKQGIKMYDGQTRQAQEKSFARISQDSADELNGQFRLQTQLQKQNLDVNMQILEKSKGIADSFKELQKNSAQQLKHLAGIEVNTFKLHKIETDIAGVKNILSDMDTKGIKIR